MSRTYKDRPYRLGGKKTRYYISSDSHAEFKAMCRRIVRAKVRDDLNQGREPSPVYPVEREYFD